VRFTVGQTYELRMTNGEGQTYVWEDISDVQISMDYEQRAYGLSFICPQMTYTEPVVETREEKRRRQIREFYPKQ